MKTSRLVLVGCAVAALVATTKSFADEKSFPMDKAPSAVQSAVKKLVGSSKVKKFSQDDENGKIAYEVEFDVHSVEHSAKVAEDGTVLEEEEEMKAADLPAAVKAALAKALPGGKVGDVSKVKADGKTFYEADVEVGKAEHELKIGLDGSILSDEIEKDEGNDEKNEAK